MIFPKEIIDNSEQNKLITFLNNILKMKPNTNFDIATAFFNIQAFSMIKDNLDGIIKFRLLLGKTPEIINKETLGDVLLEEIKKEIEIFDLSKDSYDSIKTFIGFLKKPNVEIRLFEKFLHGKAYIFDDIIVIGSSNFTKAGLTRYGELNTWKQESQAIYTRREWFDKFWNESIDFKDDLIKILEDSRFGSREYTPYELYIKTLYEYQKKDITLEIKGDTDSNLPKTKVNLAQFQEDAIARIWTRMQKYGGCIVADSVGLGKTWIAKKVLEKIGYYERKNILIVCPAQLREMWRREVKRIDVKENILSQEELASEDFLEKAKRTLGGRFDNVELIVVDESHNFRNPLSNRWENFFTLINDYINQNGNRPNILFLTATPINNTTWDLYWQIMLLVSMDRNAFVKENIGDLFQFFKRVQESPSLLNDLLNEISIRRTRNYILENYPDAYIIIEKPNGEIEEKKIIFPERLLENINYKLDITYKGMYKEISDTITDKLTMAYYKILEYKKDGIKTEQEQFMLGRMIAIGGIFRTILLKRLESSIEAFRISLSRHINFLKKLIEYLKSGKLLTKATYLKYLLSTNEELDDDEVKIILEDFKADEYNIEKLLVDINADIKLLSDILKRINKIQPEEDSKLNVLKEQLLKLSKEGQIVLFTYYADTLDYVFSEINKDDRFEKLSIEAVSSSGKTGKTPLEREKIIEKFFEKKINIILSTDVLSEGQNLQSAKFLINYDLHWNPTRMIQRAGRIDRIGSPYKQIFVYNFFPEDELEELLKLVEILQRKIIDIDKSVGLDQSILGEEIHPKVFGIIRRINKKDNSMFAELEDEIYGGGESFYQPLKDYLKNKGIESLEKIPLGIFSGLQKNNFSGIFFYYKYDDDFHFWYYYDNNANIIIKNKSEILDLIKCNLNEKRIIPDFFENVFDINKIILEDIERVYREMELSVTQESKMREISKSRSSSFVKKMIEEIDFEISSMLTYYPNRESLIKGWSDIRAALINLPKTKKRLQVLRKIWNDYKKNKNWDELINLLTEFSAEKALYQKKFISPFDKTKLQLITIDFIS